MAGMPVQSKIFLNTLAQLPFQNQKPGDGIAGISGFARIAIYRAMAVGQDATEAFAVQCAWH